MNEDKNKTANTTPMLLNESKKEGQGGGGMMQFFIGLVIGAGVVGGAWYFNSANALPKLAQETETNDGRVVEEIATTPDTSRITTTTRANGEALIVTNQAAGSSVFIDSAEVSGVSWIAIQTEDGSRILGAARIEENGFEIPVQLLSPTTAGQRYEAVIFVDDGDKIFDHRLDIRVEGVAASFTAQ